MVESRYVGSVNPLQVLGLEPPVTESSLKAAYKREMLRWHPDRCPSDERSQAEAHERAISINLAFEVLSEGIERGVTARAKPSTPSSRTASPRRQYKGQSYRAGFPDADVVEVFVKSSNIISIGYSRAKRILYVKFSGRGSVDVYRYFEVPEEVFTRFMSAESKGRFGHREVYSRFRYERC